MKISQLNNKVLYVNCSYKTKRFDIFLCQKIESNLNKKLNKYGYQIGGAGTILSTFERGFTIYDVNKSDYKNLL